MVSRGGFSFVAMLVINPIVILFYQNCSMTPVSQAANTSPARAVSSVAAPAQPVCLSHYAYCPVSSIE
jgi:hypothetical protein